MKIHYLERIESYQEREFNQVNIASINTYSSYRNKFGLWRTKSKCEKGSIN